MISHWGNFRPIERDSDYTADEYCEARGEESSAFPLSHDEGELMTTHAEFRAVLNSSAIDAWVVDKGNVRAPALNERRFSTLDTGLRVASGNLGVVEQYLAAAPPIVTVVVSISMTFPSSMLASTSRSNFFAGSRLDRGLALAVDASDRGIVIFGKVKGSAHWGQINFAPSQRRGSSSSTIAWSQLGQRRDIITIRTDLV